MGAFNVNSRLKLNLDQKIVDFLYLKVVTNNNLRF